MTERGSIGPPASFTTLTVVMTVVLLVGLSTPTLSQWWDMVVIEPAGPGGPATHSFAIDLEGNTIIMLWWNATGPLDMVISGPTGSIIEDGQLTSSTWELILGLPGTYRFEWWNHDVEHNVTLQFGLDHLPMEAPFEEPEGGSNVILPVLVAVMIAVIVISLLFWHLSRGPPGGVYPTYTGPEVGTPGAGPIDLPYPNVSGVALDTRSIICPKCGTRLTQGMRFCPDCGAEARDHRPPR